MGTGDAANNDDSRKYSQPVSRAPPCYRCEVLESSRAPLRGYPDATRLPEPPFVYDKRGATESVLGYQYSYFVGALIFIVAWVALYAFGRQHRAQMIWGSLLSAPFALTGFLFIPEYWSPPSLFNWAERFGISIEDVLWSGAVGGIAASVSEIIFHERLERMRRRLKNARYAPLIVICLVFIVLELVWPARSICNMILAFTAGSVLIALSRPDLIGRMLRGAAIFAAIYVLLFAYFLALYSDFITRYYNTENLLGLYVFGIPIEELLFAFTGGAVWSVMYEYMHSYRLVSVVPVRFARQGL
jgi:hypothetical protein